jgi:NCS1 family nucleobase:cation symporter-1
MTIQNASPSLYNEDLAPAEVRNWGPFSIFNVWTSDVHSLWGYYLAASLFLLCGSFLNFVIAIGLGSIVIFFLMSLVGNAGVRTGVPYPPRSASGARTSPRSCAPSSRAFGMARRRRRPRARSSRC